MRYNFANKIPLQWDDAFTASSLAWASFWRICVAWGTERSKNPLRLFSRVSFLKLFAVPRLQFIPRWNAIVLNILENTFFFSTQSNKACTEKIMTTSSLWEWPKTQEKWGLELHCCIHQNAFCYPTPGFNYSSLNQLQIDLFKRMQF